MRFYDVLRMLQIGEVDSTLHRQVVFSCKWARVVFRVTREARSRRRSIYN